jgi:7-cyano-7-deazaguanine synthase
MVVLLSSGLDSTVNLAKVVTETEVALALTFDYGQRAAEREISQAKKIAEHYGVAHQVVQLPWLAAITKTALVNRTADVPVGDQLSIDDKSVSDVSARAVWVPNRNGVFLNIAASFAESLGSDFVVPGFNVEEAVTFPDNSVKFLAALDGSFQYSTLRRVRTQCFTQNMNKTEIARLGRDLNAPFELMWPCYFSGPVICGQCESCLRFKRALTAATGATEPQKEFSL